MQYLSKQEKFDISAKHILVQNKQSMQEGGGYVCAYRSFDGLSCAVGVFIHNRVHIDSIEGLLASKLISDHSAIAEASKLNPALDEFFDALQSIHDDCELEDWPSYLENVATIHGLGPAIIAATIAQREGAVTREAGASS